MQEAIKNKRNYIEITFLLFHIRASAWPLALSLNNIPRIWFKWIGLTSAGGLIS